MRLLKARNKKGWTQERLAKESGVNQTTISALERDETRIPQWDTAKALADALEVDPAVLFPTRTKDRESRAS